MFLSNFTNAGWNYSKLFGCVTWGVDLRYFHHRAGCTLSPWAATDQSGAPVFSGMEIHRFSRGPNCNGKIGFPYRVPWRAGLCDLLTFSYLTFAARPCHSNWQWDDVIYLMLYIPYMYIVVISSYLYIHMRYALDENCSVCGQEYQIMPSDILIVGFANLLRSLKEWGWFTTLKHFCSKVSISVHTEIDF